MKSLAAAVLAVMGASTIAHANVEVGGIAGVHIFRENDKLGQGKDPMTPAFQSNSALFGLRLGVFFGHKIGVEAEAGVIPTEGKTADTVFGTTNITGRAHLVYQARAANPANQLIPFGFVGGGLFRVVDSKNTDYIKKDDSAWAVYAGVGAKYRASHSWGIRVDLRAMIVPASDKAVTQDFEGLFSIYREWGRPKKAIAPEAPKTDDDPDKDGILAAADKCPTEAEDKDAFEDENGCPDPDNDADGVADANDKCATDAEDKDSFQDDDGCPDPDNDGDGVPDAADKCATDPETKNGFQDDDGCPDEIPEQLRAFTGVIQGITFKTSSSELQAASGKVLDKAVAVLAEFKDTKLEIAGHTDDVPLKGNKQFADNQALSQARAESVKAYFVKKGIDESRLIAKGYGDSAPVEAPTGLTGGKLTAARAKNRRVEFKLVTAESAEAPPPPPAPAPEEKKE